ncbi:MAG TPA: hypothetical protein EYQ20_03945 [candidate division Zixibacteria bacterium]|nr:hypothetical protein [candidate division Zixibacteria bacterium]
MSRSNLDGPSSGERNKIPTQRVTLRSILIGLSLAVFISVWIPYNIWILKSSAMDFEHLSVGVMIPFLFIVIVVNGCLRRVSPAAVLTASELIVIISIAMIASTVPSAGLMGYFIAVISTPYYFASPENQWAEVFFQYLPPWLVADNSKHQMQWFYEGLPWRASIPWRTWFTPLFWWGSFFMVLFFVGSCIMVILRRQWIVHEKLAFPLSQVILQIVEQPTDRSFLPPFMQSRLFWVGFGIPVCIIGWNAINYFTPVGIIPVGPPNNTLLTIGHYFPTINIKINLYILCFAFFSPVDILFSIWLFHLLAILETGGMNAIGLVETGASPVAAVTSQEIGGLIIFVFWSVWMARGHLRDVWRRAILGSTEVDDSNEFFSYRAAVFGVVFGVTYMACWLYAAGMDAGILILFLMLLFIFYIGVARIVAETGLVALDLPLNSHEFLVRAIGSSRISPSSLTTFGLTNTFARNWKTFTMVTVSHITKIGDQVWTDKRKMFGIICLSFALALVVGAVYTIYTGYATVGAYHFGQFAFTTGNIAFFENIKIWINNPKYLSTLEAVWFGLGGVVMSILISLKYWFPGWPIHPVGFTIARGVAIDGAFFTIFLVWMIKAIVLRVGGISMYKQTQPFFLGMLVGFATGMVLNYTVDMIWFPGQGHRIHGW